MKQHILILLLFAGGSTYLFGQPNLTRKVDYSSEVTNAQQQYPFWCVYACMEAIENTDQDFNCGWYYKIL